MPPFHPITRGFYNKKALEIAEWQEHHNRYFHREVWRSYRDLVTPGSSVLEVGCGMGNLLATLEPGFGVGVDFSENTLALAKKTHPSLHFTCMNAHALNLKTTFDFIVVSGLLGELEDIQLFLEGLHPLCHSRTRLIVDYYSHLWEPLWKVAEFFHLKLPQRPQNWLRMADLLNLLTLAGFEPITFKHRHLCPFNIPGVAWLSNRVLVNLPGIRALGMAGLAVARLPLSAKCRMQNAKKPDTASPFSTDFPLQTPHSALPSCSIIVPCRNEKGNIAGVFERTPELGSWSEIIFIDGNSTDGTLEEIEKQASLHPARKVQWFSQGPTKGKGDAVRQGFARARGDILMILDADLTVPPEDLPKFYQVLVSGRGEFVNGSRMVYPMEKQAMRFLNLIANWAFGLIFTWLLEQSIRDTLCGTKALYRSDYEKIARRRAYFDDRDPFGDFDLIFGAKRLSLKIVDLPVRYRERTYGATNIQRFRHGWQLLKVCFVALRKIKMK